MNKFNRFSLVSLQFTSNFLRKKLLLVGFLGIYHISSGQNLVLNEKEYFETPGLNVLVFSNEYNGMFFDEKTAGIEFIHHGVRTVTGGAVRLHNTPEQWDLIPKMISRKVDKLTNTIEVELRYEEYDFNSRQIGRASCRERVF